MAHAEFDPVTPGEMLKEEFLAEYGLSQNELAKADHRRYRAPARALFRQQRGVLDESADRLRT